MANLTACGALLCTCTRVHDNSILSRAPITPHRRSQHVRCEAVMSPAGLYDACITLALTVYRLQGLVSGNRCDEW